MNLVVDTSVVLKWFRTEKELRIEEANLLLQTVMLGRVSILAPAIIRLEILNVAARKWKLAQAELEVVASGIEKLGIEFCEVPTNLVVPWIAGGLTAYDAAFVALAQSRDAVVVSDDRHMVAVGGDLVVPLLEIRDILA